VGFVGVYFKWIAAAVAVWLAYRYGRAAWVRHCTATDAWAAEQKAIAARADQQHSQVMSGDERGMYGEAWSSVRQMRRRMRPRPH
jgi:hypothetical protein